MKKVSLVLVALLCVFSVWAGAVNFVLNVKPYFTFDNAPAGIDADTGYLNWKNSVGLVNADWWGNQAGLLA